MVRTLKRWRASYGGPGAYTEHLPTPAAPQEYLLECYTLATFLDQYVRSLLALHWRLKVSPG